MRGTLQRVLRGMKTLPCWQSCTGLFQPLTASNKIQGLTPVRQYAIAGRAAQSRLGCLESRSSSLARSLGSVR